MFGITQKKDGGIIGLHFQLPTSLYELRRDKSPTIKNAVEFETRVPSGRIAQAIAGTGDVAVAPKQGLGEVQSRNLLRAASSAGQTLLALSAIIQWIRQVWQLPDR